jgi:hypothetical protein
MSGLMALDTSSYLAAKRRMQLGRKNVTDTLETTRLDLRGDIFLGSRQVGRAGFSLAILALLLLEHVGKNLSFSTSTEAPE